MRQRLLLLGLAGALAAPTALHAQTGLRYTLQGTVTDAAGEPLVGVNVQLTQQRIGAVTDLDGRYRFEAMIPPGRYAVTFSYVGYATRTETLDLVSSQTDVTLNVRMQEDAVGLDEVVVTGTGAEATRRQLGNNISIVTAEAAEQMGTPNPLGALAGRVAGAQVTQNSGDPAGGFSLQLRGLSSIKGSSDPLYIVDGVIVDNSSTNVINLQGDAMQTSGAFGQNRLVDINPADIERIEVLNGAAAAAIYGSRASNGVVQIFTKRGSQGAPRVEYAFSLTQNRLRDAPALTTYGKRFGIRGNADLTTTQDRLTTLTTVGITAAEITAAGGTFVQAPGRILVTSQYDVQRYNYWDDIFETAYGQEHNLSISGGRDQTRYYASFGALDNGGIVRNTAFQKYNGRLRLDQQLSSWLNASVGLAVSQSRSNDMPVGTNFFSPISTVYIIDNVWDLNARDAAGNLKMVEAVRVNPLSVIETFKINQETNRTTGNLNLTATPLAGLSLSGVVGFDTYTLTGTEYHPRLPYQAVTVERNVPGSTTGATTAQAQSVSADFYPDGYAAIAKSNVGLLNTDLTASYRTGLTATLNSTTTAGASYQYSSTNFTASQGRDLSPFVTTIRSVINTFTPAQETRTERSIYGGFLQETLGLREELFLTLAGRIDGSSAFAEDYRTQFYPKASVAWVASERWKANREGSLFRNVPTLKLRASYGEAGNLTGIGAYDRFDNYVTSPITGSFALQPSRQLANPEVRPERMREVELGVEAGLFGGRTALVFNWYTQKVTDLLFDVPIPATAGGTSITTNLGDENTYLRNQGIELQLNTNVYRRSSVSVDLGFTYNRNANTVEGSPSSFALRGSDGAQYVVNGQPFGVFYGRYYARNADGSFLLTSATNPGVGSFAYDGLRQPARGIFGAAARAAAGATLVANTPENVTFCETAPTGDQSRCETVNAAGQPVGTELRKILGSPDPDWTGGLTFDVRAGKFTFHTLVDAVQGFEVYNWNRITANNVGHGAIAEAELRGEVARGTVGSIAGGVTGQRIQEEHVEDGSFFKLREVAVSYDFGRVWRAQGLSVTLAGRNLLSIDDYQGFDPETNAGGQNDRVRGDDFGNVPIPRTVQLRFNVRF